MASGIPEELLHKNRLQQLSLKLFAQYPTFDTPNEGCLHDPKFRPTVVVDGTKIISPLTFNRRKDAEQYVSKIALEHTYAKLKKEGLRLINSTSMYCKSILHEFAVKKRISLPAYTTSNVEAMLPMFRTSINFDGNTFHGSLSRNKKDAEQLGARSAIQWILDQPDDKSTRMAEIIMMKYKLFKETHGDSNLPLAVEINPPLQTMVNDHPSGTDNKEKNMSNASSKTQGPAEVNPTPPALGQSKEKLMAIVLPAEAYGAPNAELNSSNLVPVNLCLEQTKVKVEESFEVSPSIANSSTPGKRSRKKNKRGRAKKTRMD